MPLAAALSLDGQDALKGCCRNSQPLGHGNIIFHGFGHTVPANNQHMRTAEQVTAHVDAAFMLLGNSIIEKQGQVQGRANRRKACLIHGAAILRRQFCVFAIAAEPCSGDISKGSFHRSYLRYFNKKVQPKPHALSQSWERGRLWRIYPRRLPGK